MFSTLLFLYEIISLPIAYWSEEFVLGARPHYCFYLFINLVYVNQHLYTRALLYIRDPGHEKNGDIFLEL